MKSKIDLSALCRPSEKSLGVINTIIAILIAFIMGGLMVIISGDNPFEAYAILLRGSFGGVDQILSTIRFTIPIVFLAYSFSICGRCGYFNIGQEGQIYAASLAILAVSHYAQALPLFVRLFLMLICACTSSAIVCLIPAIIKFKLGASEIVSGVMSNYIMALLLQHILSTTELGVPGAALVSKNIDESIPAELLMVIAVVVVVAYQFILKKTVPGYRLGVIGRNPVFAKACGLPSMKVIYSSAIISGVLVGIMSCGEILVYFHKVTENFAAGVGFNGMTAALIGAHSPIGMLLGSLLLGTLKSGSVLLTVLTDVPSEIVECVQGFVLFFATVSILKASKKQRSTSIKKGGK